MERRKKYSESKLSSPNIYRQKSEDVKTRKFVKMRRGGVNYEITVEFSGA